MSPRAPEGQTVWAIGDVHGRLDLLEPLVEGILADAAEGPAGGTEVVFLGDYVDRGPDSRGVLKYLARLRERPGVRWRFLKGNHEEAMLQFLEDPTFGPEWCRYGGGATLRSYGLNEPQITHRPESWKTLSQDLDHKVSPEERDFLETLELSAVAGDYFFAHAGARPGQTLENQLAHDLLWVRRSFLDSDHVFAKIVVHGHTPTSAVHSDHRRIGVDTKAYESGVLSALRLKSDRRSVLQAALPAGSDGEPALSRFPLDQPSIPGVA